MARAAIERLTVEHAEEMFGERFKALAPTHQVLSNWRARGIPWEVIGPLVMERLSQALGLPPSNSLGLGADMHKVLDAQGRVFQLASRYGVDSPEFRMLLACLENFIPAIAAPPKRLPPKRQLRRAIARL